MKRFLLLVLALCLFISCCFAEEGTDTITSASVVDYYGTALEGDELMNAINSFTGFYAVTTVNPDGTPLTGFFIYSCVKDEDGNYYLGLGLGEPVIIDTGIRFAFKSDLALSQWDFGFGVQVCGEGILPTVELGFFIWGIPVLLGIGVAMGG